MTDSEYDHGGNDDPEPDEPFLADERQGKHDFGAADDGDLLLPEPPRPSNWDRLSADAAEAEWLELNTWVNWLRRTYGLPASIIPPFWHRHPELVWELSALHLHWLGAYDPDQHGSAPLGWHRDFAEARHRLREWVAQSGTRLDRDRPLRRTPWPGEQPNTDADEASEAYITNRDGDFVQFVLDDVDRRRRIEEQRNTVREQKGRPDGSQP